mmetsp:Transcript_61543/g.144196  ORF Transcript_61543/g.144196 Transcript_61543/m.144196 type:complete len:234 (+) Transcript_61543:1092-1793(+)
MHDEGALAFLSRFREPGIQRPATTLLVLAQAEEIQEERRAVIEGPCLGLPLHALHQLLKLPNRGVVHVHNRRNGLLHELLQVRAALAVDLVVSAPHVCRHVLDGQGRPVEAVVALHGAHKGTEEAQRHTSEGCRGDPSALARGVVAQGGPHLALNHLVQLGELVVVILKDPHLISELRLAFVPSLPSLRVQFLILKMLVPVCHHWPAVSIFGEPVQLRLSRDVVENLSTVSRI